MQVREYKGQPKQIAGMAVLLEKLKNAEEDFNRVDAELSDINYYIDYYLGNPEYTAYMAHTDGHYIGFIVGYHLLNDTYKLVMLYVHPDHRKQNIAMELKERLTEHAKEKGYKRIVSCIRTDHFISNRLNQKSGWVGEPDKINRDKFIWYTKEL